MKLSRLALAACAVLALSSAAASQTQPIPGAINASGSPANVGGVSPVIAPAGGGAGRGAVVAEDHGLPVNCILGCSGGGGGGGAVFGPTAVGSPAANPPVQVGGTVDGTATGAVDAWKVDTSGFGYVFVGNSFNLEATQLLIRADIASMAGNIGTIAGAVGTPLPAQSSHGVNTGGVEGVAAAGTSDTDNPLDEGCRAASASPTAVTDGQKVKGMCTLSGKRVVWPYAIPANLVSGVTTSMTNTTPAQLLAAPAAGFRNYVTTLVCGNSHATVGTFVDLEDGNGGTVIGTFPAREDYGGSSVPLLAPIRQPTTATALYAVNETTGAAVKCTAYGFVSQE